MGQGMGSGMEMGGGGGMDGMVMAAGLPSPAMILRAKEALGLAMDQVRALESIQSRYAAEAKPRKEAMMSSHTRAAEILRSESVNLADYEAALKEAAASMAASHVSAARAGLEARAVLTPDQRGRLSNLLSMMRDMMCGAAAAR